MLLIRAHPRPQARKYRTIFRLAQVPTRDLAIEFVGYAQSHPGFRRPVWGQTRSAATEVDPEELFWKPSPKLSADENAADALEAAQHYWKKIIAPARWWPRPELHIGGKSIRAVIRYGLSVQRVNIRLRMRPFVMARWLSSASKREMQTGGR